MKVLRDPQSVMTIADAGLRALISQRFAELSQDQSYEPDLLGIIVVVEPGDRLEELERQTRCPIRGGWCPNASYDEPDFIPAWEYLDEHACCYEMVFVLSDGGYGVVLIVPKHPAIDECLLRICARFATPAPIGEDR